ncbi:MAG: Cadherin protein [Planctomycetaceae bacterium]|nr:Cadherin protein [Planctomycetaceae bacterium]
MQFWSCLRWPSALVRRVGSGRARVRPRSGLFHVESLESRELLTSFMVTSLGDTSDPGTLRWAIEQANSSAGADSISFDSTFFNTERSITLQGTQLPTFTDVTGTTTVNGPGWGLLAVSSSYNSRIFEVASGVSVAINDLTVSRGKLTDQNGGAILSNGTLTLTNTHVTDSSAVSGGAIYNGPSTVLKLINSAIIHNSASEDGGAIFNAGILSIVDSNVTQNDAQNGGAIASGPVAELLTISDSTFLQNTATGSGGAVYNTGSIVKVTSTVFNANEAKSGGAIANIDGGILALSLSTILGNHATDFGGGIYSTVGLATDPTTISISGTTIQGNSSGLQGGGIYSDGTCQIAYSDVASNVTIDDGGGILSLGALTVSNTGFSGNSGASGGAIAGKSATTVDHSIFHDNTATIGNGGGILSSASLDVADSVFTDNRVTPDGKDGGGIASFASATVKSSQFIGNSARNGGGVFSMEMASITSSTFSGNTAESGGGIATMLGLMTISDTTIKDNVASAAGGGLYDAYSSQVIVDHSTISGNSAEEGGGMHIGPAGRLDVRRSIVDNNSATRGGGFYVFYSSPLVVTSSTISENSADQGGGIYNTGLTRVFGSTFTGNAADQGGAVYHGSQFDIRPELTVVNSTIVDNQAQVAGGGLFQSTLPESVLLANTIIARNARGGDSDDISGTIDAAGSTHNLIGPGGAGGLAQGGNGNIVLASNSTLGLGTLGYYGGPTPTIPLLEGSPAIDAGTMAILDEFPDVAFDQTGSGRGLGQDFDIGAVESRFTVVSASVAENQLAVLTVSVNVPYTAPLAFSLTGGADQALFSINPVTGEISFISQPDFENPGDSDTDNVYRLQVTVTDFIGGTSLQDISVTVQNVVEDAALTVSSDPATYQIRGTAVVDTAADLHTDGAMTYSSAQLVVSISANRDVKDLLKIASQGKGAGQISVKQNKILFGGVVIGTLAGGTKAMPNLVITFNAAATEAAVDALLKRVSFSTKNGRLPQLPRTLQMQLTNLAGGSTNIATRQINVVARS